jgi:hypothetical protein
MDKKISTEHEKRLQKDNQLKLSEEIIKEYKSALVELAK